MNETPLTVIETVTCSRCGGTGKYSFCTMYGSTCFKCSGAKTRLTKRGFAANEYLLKLRSRAMKDIKVGDLVREVFGNPMGPQMRAFGKVTKSYMQTEPTSWHTVDGVIIPLLYWVLEITHSKYGGVAIHNAPEHLCRVAMKAEEKASTFALALQYQEALTKTGKVRAAGKGAV